MAAAALCGCSWGFRSPSGGTALVPSSENLRGPVAGGSWMQPSASSTDLIYVTGPSGTYSIVYVYSYPAGKLVGKIIHAISGLCSDSHGNVFMTQSWYSASRILEYAHGGRRPIAILRDSHSGVAGCAIDPRTGDLAVANADAVLIYPQAKGKPKVHLIWFAPDYVGYDGQGHLYAFGDALAGLAKNGQFQRVKYQKHVFPQMGIQWDGKYMALGEGTDISNNGLIRRYTIKGRTFIWQSGVQLNSSAYGFYIYGSLVFVSTGNGVGVFDYPAGGDPIQMISAPTSGPITLSVAP
jgi:WD40 repeat protein